MSPLTKDSSSFVAELEVKQEFHILNALVVQPDSSTEDAVQQILNITSASIKDPTSLGNHLYNTACCLLEIAARTPPVQQPKLVTFVYLLQKRTVTDPATSEPLRHDGDLIWTELPTFGYTFADELGSFSEYLPAFLQSVEPMLIDTQILWLLTSQTTRVDAGRMQQPSLRSSLLLPLILTSRSGLLQLSSMLLDHGKLQRPLLTLPCERHACGTCMPQIGCGPTSTTTSSWIINVENGIVISSA